MANVLRLAQAALTTISQTPGLDAELLLCRALRRERSYLHARPETILTTLQSQEYDALLERRAQGEPLAYILGVREFWSLPIRVTRDVLVPRPDTELLVELALARIPWHEALEIADLGTGSGAIALAIASERPRCGITATDISQAALEVAADNADRLGLTNIRFVASDWFSSLSGCFHMIVSNPPYVAAEDSHLQDPALKFEPRESLISDLNGLADLNRITQNAGAFLHPGGWLIVEHGREQGAAVRELFKKSDFTDVKSNQDLAGHERATVGQLAS